MIEYTASITVAAEDAELAEQLIRQLFRETVLEEIAQWEKRWLYGTAVQSPEPTEHK